MFITLNTYGFRKRVKRIQISRQIGFEYLQWIYIQLQDSYYLYSLPILLQ